MTKRYVNMNRWSFLDLKVRDFNLRNISKYDMQLLFIDAFFPGPFSEILSYVLVDFTGIGHLKKHEL